MISAIYGSALEIIVHQPTCFADLETKGNAKSTALPESLRAVPDARLLHASSITPFNGVLYNPSGQSTR
jgi:hypothetical protein